MKHLYKYVPRLSIILFFTLMCAHAFLVECTKISEICNTDIDSYLNDDGITCFMFLRHDCPATKAVAHKVEELNADYAEQGFRMIGFFPDEDADSALSAAVGEVLGMTIPIYPDPELQMANCTGARVTPQFILYNRGKQIVYSGSFDDYYYGLARHRTQVKHHYLEDAINAVLNGEEVLVPETKAIGCVIQ